MSQANSSKTLQDQQREIFEVLFLSEHKHHCTKKFSVKDFFSKCDQIRNFLQIWSHLLKKYLMKNFIFCAVHIGRFSNLHQCTFQLMSRKFLFTNRKDNKNCQKVSYFLRKQHISRLNYCKIMNSWNTKFSKCFFDLHDCSSTNSITFRFA